MEYTHHYESPLGGITLASNGEALIGLWFDGQKYFADALEKEHEEKLLPIFEEVERWLDMSICLSSLFLRKGQRYECAYNKAPILPSAAAGSGDLIF